MEEYLVIICKVGGFVGVFRGRGGGEGICN